MQRSQNPLYKAVMVGAEMSQQKKRVKEHPFVDIRDSAMSPLSVLAVSKVCCPAIAMLLPLMCVTCCSDGDTMLTHTAVRKRATPHPPTACFMLPRMKCTPRCA